MDLRQLKYFLAVAEEKQITKAAKRLFITQPPLSQQLIALEKELGVLLFDRTGKSMQLTDAGRILKDKAERIFELVDVTTTQLQESGSGVSGHLSIGTITTSGNSLLPERIQKFHHAYPRVSFYVRQGETDKVLDMLDSGLADVGFVRFPVDSERYDYITFPDERMAVVLSTQEAKRLEAPTDAKRLLTRPLLIHQRHKHMIVDYCHRVGIEPEFLCISDDILPLLLLANSGMGTAVLPDSAQNVFPGGTLAFLELTDPVLATTSALAWSRKRPPRPVAAHFIDFFR